MDNFRIINIYTNIVMKGNNQGNANVNYDLSSNDNRVYFAKPTIRPREEEDGPESYTSFGDIKSSNKSRVN